MEWWKAGMLGIKNEPPQVDLSLIYQIHQKKISSFCAHYSNTPVFHYSTASASGTVD
jgi:hypothetical protein